MNDLRWLWTFFGFQVLAEKNRTEKKTTVKIKSKKQNSQNEYGVELVRKWFRSGGPEVRWSFVPSHVGRVPATSCGVRALPLRYLRPGQQPPSGSFPLRPGAGRRPPARCALWFWRTTTMHDRVGRNGVVGDSWKGTIFFFVLTRGIDL